MWSCAENQTLVLSKQLLYYWAISNSQFCFVLKRRNGIRIYIHLYQMPIFHWRKWKNSLNSSCFPVIYSKKDVLHGVKGLGHFDWLSSYWEFCKWVCKGKPERWPKCLLILSPSQELRLGGKALRGRTGECRETPTPSSSLHLPWYMTSVLNRSLHITWEHVVLWEPCKMFLGILFPKIFL